MGMAASQVRLLALTDRLHDVELKAQQILSQKLALGTQKDALYNDYCNALEATNYMVAFRNDNGSTRYVDATFENLCTYNPDRSRTYALYDTRSDKILVSDDEKDTYDTYSNDKYAYAMAMLGLENFGTGHNGGNNVGTYVGLNTNKGIGSDTYLTKGILPEGIGGEGNYTAAGGQLTENELEMYEIASKSNNGLKEALDNYKDMKPEEEESEESFNERKAIEANRIRDNFGDLILKTPKGNSITTGDGNDVLMTEAELSAFMKADAGVREDLQGDIDAIYADDCKEPQKAFEDFRKNLYAKLGDKIYEEMHALAGNGDDCEFPNQEFKFHVERWEAIKNAGGCEVVDSRFEDGEEGREWLENMIRAGLVVIQDCNNNGEWEDTSIATSTNGNNLAELPDDSEIRAIEAKYEHELDIIDRKETKLDNELAKLETERKAMTTEMESLKTVKDDNIDRTFGIFG